MLQPLASLVSCRDAADAGIPYRNVGPDLCPVFGTAPRDAYHDDWKLKEWQRGWEQLPGTPHPSLVFFG